MRRTVLAVLLPPARGWDTVLGARWRALGPGPTPLADRAPPGRSLPRELRRSVGVARARVGRAWPRHGEPPRRVPSGRRHRPRGTAFPRLDKGPRVPPSPRPAGPLVLFPRTSPHAARAAEGSTWSARCQRLYRARPFPSTEGGAAPRALSCGATWPPAKRPRAVPSSRSRCGSSTRVGTFGPRRCRPAVGVRLPAAHRGPVGVSGRAPPKQGGGFLWTPCKSATNCMRPEARFDPAVRLGARHHVPDLPRRVVRRARHASRCRLLCQRS